MKRGFIAVLFALILSLSIVSAAPDLEVSKDPINIVIVKELNVPAIFNMTIKNVGEGDAFVIDTLLDVLIMPKDHVAIGHNEEKTVQIKIYPKSTEKNRYTGIWSFNYFIKGDSTGVFYDNLRVKVLSINDVLSLDVPASVKAEDSSISVRLKNNENISIPLDITLDSSLAYYTDNFTIQPFEEKEMVIDLDSEKLSREAGTYNFKASIIANNEYEHVIVKDLILESNVEILSDSKIESSTFVERLTLSKENVGNTPTAVTITANRSLIQSLITTYSIKPDKVTRIGGSYVYEWNSKLNPNEKLTVEVKTNYSWPWIVLIILVVCYCVVRQITKKQMYIRKKAYRVKTKDGRFASKIILMIKNRGKEVSNTKIIEPIPPFTELVQDRFGTIKPAEVKKHAIVWDMPFISAREEFILSYIVYSKVSILGSIEVAPAVVTYQTGKGMIKESKSNKIIILAEEKTAEPKSELIK